MPVKLRLQRRGRRKKPFYHIVAADSRAPRDGKFIEKIGTYNPMTNPATIDLDADRAYSWLENGAQPTDTVKAILKYKGVLYRKHLNRGVKKGAFSREEADQIFEEYMAGKEKRRVARVEKTALDKRDFHIAVFGKTPEKETPVPEVPAPEASAAAEEE